LIEKRLKVRVGNTLTNLAVRKEGEALQDCNGEIGEKKRRKKKGDEKYT